MRLIVAIFLLLGAIPRATADEPLRISGKAFGSYYSIVIDTPGSADPGRLKAEIESLFTEINRQMSNWDDDSEISRFNRSDSTNWFPVSTEFATVVEESRRISSLTGGALDITMAPLIEHWGFGRNKQRRVPSEEEIQKARSIMGMENLEVRVDPPALRKNIPELQLNVSSLAPGFAADQVATLLRAHQLSAFVVDVGGENLAGREKASGEPWKIGVELPLGGLHRVVKLTERAIATSGEYRSFFVHEGKRFSHILNPATGRPVENPPACVSVIHRSCMTADGLATAMMVLGSEKGMQLAAQADFDVMFLDVDEAGQLKETSTGAFQSSDPQ